jgi:hypothetical protein
MAAFFGSFGLGAGALPPFDLAYYIAFCYSSTLFFS